MHFETIEHRRVTIKELEGEDRKRAVKEYLRQLQVYEIMDKDKIAIDKNIADKLLSIYSESNKFIGVILVRFINEKVGYLEISVPNPAWNMRYGTEALHQIVKRCKVMELKMLTLKESDIVKRYKAERPEIFFKGTNKINFIKVNV